MFSIVTGLPGVGLVIVTVSNGLLVPTTVFGNVSVVGVICNVGSTPVPLSVTLCGLPFALSEIVSVPMCGLAKPGAKTSEITQDWPGGKIPPQPGCWSNPCVVETCSINTLLEPLGLVTVTISWLLLAPITVFGKLSFVGVILSE